MKKKDTKIRNIKDGVVIDHIPAGKSLEVLRILGIDQTFPGIITLAMNVPSSQMQRKDLLKIENRDLNPDELHKIALVAPNATINNIKDYKVVRKEKVKLPKVLVGIVPCPNPNCITNNSKEHVKTHFQVIHRSPLRLRCKYCERTVEYR